MYILIIKINVIRDVLMHNVTSLITHNELIRNTQTTETVTNGIVFINKFAQFRATGPFCTCSKSG